MLFKLISGLIVGGVSGFAANKIMKGKSEGMFRNILLGVAGGFVGGYLGNLIGIGDGWISGILLAIAGSCLIIWIAGKISK